MKLQVFPGHLRKLLLPFLNFSSLITLTVLLHLPEAKGVRDEALALGGQDAVLVTMRLQASAVESSLPALDWTKRRPVHLTL